jgi:peptidoglycan/xylan/chitin deacetylase (PgdA/CDA1 family)
VNLPCPRGARPRAVLLTALLLAACDRAASSSDTAASDSVPPASVRAPGATGASPSGAAAITLPTDTALRAAAARRTPNELGRIPVLMYHLIEDRDGTYRVAREHFREQLGELYARGYRPVTLGAVLDGQIDLPAGLSPVVLTFDDASPSQFRYVERNGALRVDATSGWGILTAFAAEHPDFPPVGVWCLLSAAQAGRSFFGDKGIEGQASAWRFRKLTALVEAGGELCNHTQWHARLDRSAPALVQEQIAKLQLAVDSAITGYRIRTMALPLGIWPKDRALAYAGSWTDPKRAQRVAYAHEAVLTIGGGLLRSPHAPGFFDAGPRRVIVPREEVLTPALFTALLDRVEKVRYVSDGDPARVAAPPAPPAAP